MAHVGVPTFSLRFKNSNKPAMLRHKRRTYRWWWAHSNYEPNLPVTEKSNPITRDIDANSKEIVQMLQKCDTEIFERTYGNPMYQVLCCLPVIQTIVDITKRVEVILKDPENSLIVLSGCGSSGRVAFLLVTFFTRWLASHHRKQIYSYIIAGGDRALLTSQKTPEDDPLLGALLLDKACVGKKHVLFIGIFCGLSEQIIAGQLDFCLRNLEIFTPVLFEFIPVDMARTEPFRTERMYEIQKQQKAYVLNPAVGPEAISGSSRMKGGSATKIILKILFKGHKAAYNRNAVTLRYVLKGCLPSGNKLDFLVYVNTHMLFLLVILYTAHTYSQTKELAALVQKAVISLPSKGHVYYLGWQTLCIMGIIGASECIPTFGAGFEDIRGFVSNGFSEMNNKEEDLSSLGPHFIIDHRDNILPNLSDNDTVLSLYGKHDDLNRVSVQAERVWQHTSNLHAIAHELNGLCDLERMRTQFMTILTIKWPSALHKNNLVMKQYWELSTKWYLNVISTGAHVLRKVYMNYMIDLKVTNSKLYRRAIHILQRFTGSTQEQCETALLRAIYDVEELSAEMILSDVTLHTLVANERDRAVPVALMMLRSRRKIAEAKCYLDASVIWDAVATCQRLL
ncbi:LOW QUALITY PROTEIN: glucokinase regulatory protein [Clarias gariepinus]